MPICDIEFLADGTAKLTRQDGSFAIAPIPGLAGGNCVPVSFVYPQNPPIAAPGTYYEHTVPLAGTAPFAVAQYDLPVGMSAIVVDGANGGYMLKVYGTLPQASTQFIVVVSNCDGHAAATWSSALSVA